MEEKEMFQAESSSNKAREHLRKCSKAKNVEFDVTAKKLSSKSEMTNIEWRMMTQNESKSKFERAQKNIANDQMQMIPKIVRKNVAKKKPNLVEPRQKKSLST